MGWCGGSELAADVWSAIRNLLPAGDARTIAARKIIYYFEQRDCDTMVEASELCEDAGWVYDESVYTPLLDSRVGCDLGVPCRDCPKATTAFQRLAAVGEADRQREAERRLHESYTLDAHSYNMGRQIEEVGNLIAAEALRRAVEPKSAADIMKDAGVPNMLAGRPLNLNLGATDANQRSS